MLYAADLPWWESPSGQRALKEFKGEKWTLNKEAADRYGIRFIPGKKGCGVGRGFVFHGGGNSGYQAVNLALQRGVAEMILVGFTMMAINGKKHWHPDHRGNNPTPDQLAVWASNLDDLQRRTSARMMAHGETALTFPRVPLVPECRGVIAVARSGGWVTPEYAERMHARTGALILTDMQVNCPSIPLKHDWPGWWAKMEIMRPDIEGDWLYLDMDTLIPGGIEALKVGRLAMLGDYYRPILESGVMYLPSWARTMAWDRWTQDPAGWMRAYNGDGPFLRDTFGHLAADLRNEVDGLHSYKVHGLQPDTRLLIYHGSPRPHETRHWHEL